MLTSLDCLSQYEVAGISRNGCIVTLATSKPICAFQEYKIRVRDSEEERLVVVLIFLVLTE